MGLRYTTQYSGGVESAAATHSETPAPLVVARACATNQLAGPDTACATQRCHSGTGGYICVFLLRYKRSFSRELGPERRVGRRGGAASISGSPGRRICICSAGRATFSPRAQ